MKLKVKRTILGTFFNFIQMVFLSYQNFKNLKVCGECDFMPPSKNCRYSGSATTLPFVVDLQNQKIM